MGGEVRGGGERAERDGEGEGLDKVLQMTGEEGGEGGGEGGGGIEEEGRG